jgi:hypothetical protein
MKRAYHIIFFGLLIQVSLISACALGQERQWDVEWDPPILLSDTTIDVDAHTPEIALSGDRIVHVTWQGPVEIWPYARSTDGGSTFVTRSILPDTSASLRTIMPSIVADDTTVIALARLSPPWPQPDRLCMVRSLNAGVTWGPIQIASDSASDLWSPAISRDTVTFTYRPPPGYVEILRSTNRGDTWTRTHQRFDTDSRAYSANGMVHMVVISCSSGYCGLEYRRSRTLGETWEDIKFIREPQTNFVPQDPNIVARSSAAGNYVFAMWRDRMYGGCGGMVGCTLVGRMGVVEADSTRWLPIRVMTSLPLGYWPEFASSKAGFAAVWPMDQEATPFAEVRISEDTTWSMSYDPVTLPATAVVTIRAALSSSAIHVVWEQKVVTNTDHYWAMYRRGRLVSTEADEHPPWSVSEVSLHQNYPNPFNNETSIPFVVGGTKADHVSLVVFDILGSEVARLVERSLEPGVHSARWETSRVGSGVYFCRLTTTTKSVVRKMMLIR